MDISCLPKDTVVDRTFTIIRKLGEGYSGVVYLAEDERRNRNVAIKFLKKIEKDYDLRTKRFKEEYKKQLVGKELRNIAEIYEFGQFEGFLYFTSEFVSETNIFRACRGIPIDKAVNLFIQMFEGLDFLHRSGILHLDIKPENVLVEIEEGKTIVKLVDFGVAARTSEEIRLAGTPLYVAPEVALGQKEKIGARSDMFSAAVLMYYCLTTMHPFCDRSTAGDLHDVSKGLATELPPEPLTKFKRDAPEYLNTLVLRLLAANPDDRFYPNARAVINSLRTSSSEGFGTGVLQSYLRPVGNRHIGREEIQTALKSAVVILSVAKDPVNSPLFHLTGHFGLGKTHLLETLKDEAAVSPESIYISTLSFPADELAIEAWAGGLQRELSDNARSVLILADDVHNCNPEDGAGITIRKIIDTIAERKKNPKLYEGIKPVMLVMAGEHSESSFAAQGFSPANKERYDWSKITQAGGARAWELGPFSKEELLKYLKSTPALKDKEISEKWLEYLKWVTSGFPADIVAHLEERDAGKMLFGVDGELITPYTIEPNMDEPSINVTSLTWMPLPAKERLLKQYSKLEPLEREVVNLMSVWNHWGVTRPITEDDIIGFFFSPAIKQTVNNLVEKHVIARHEVPKQSRGHSACHSERSEESRELTFTHPYLQSVVYDQLPQLDKETIHGTIADYLKNDEDGILLHRGYGSCHSVSLIKLAQQSVRSSGNLKLAIELLKDALVYCGKGQFKLKIYIRSFLITCLSDSGQYEKAVKTFESAINELDIKLLVWRVVLLNKVAAAYFQLQRFKEAEGSIEEAKRLVDGQDTPLAIKTRNLSGRYLYEKYFRLNEGKETLLKAKAVFEETKQEEERSLKENRSMIQNNELGYVLIEIGDHEHAIAELLEKLTRHKKEKNILAEISTDIVLANTFQLLKKYEEAEKFALYALKIANTTRVGKWIILSHHILANVYHDSGKRQKAWEECNKCFAIGSALEDVGNWITVQNQLWVQMGHLAIEEKMTDKAVLYLETAIQKGIAGHYAAQAHLGLAEIYVESGDLEKAEYHTKAAEGIINNLPESSQPFCKPRLDALKTRISKN